MVNSLDSYRELGRQAARAVNNQDGHTHRFHLNTLTQRISVEAEADRATAVEAYDTAYREARNVARKFEPFR